VSAVRHVVLLRFTPETDEATRATVVADLAELIAGLVERSAGLIAGTAGRDLGLSTGAMDAGLVLDAVDADAWTAYQQDPDHRTFVTTRLAPLLAERVTLQFEIPSP
jgi:hypothetical protein